MTIQIQIKIVNRVKSIVEELQQKYHDNSQASLELKELHQALIKFLNYLSNLDQLKPNYNTNEVQEFVQEVTLHLDILSAEIARSDFVKLKKSVSGMKTVLKFHGTKYSFFGFIVAWFVELIYFI